jgi:hypothetical protein
MRQAGAEHKKKYEDYTRQIKTDLGKFERQFRLLIYTKRPTTANKKTRTRDTRGLCLK